MAIPSTMLVSVHRIVLGVFFCLLIQDTTAIYLYRTMPEMLKVLDKPTDLRVYTIAQVSFVGASVRYFFLSIFVTCLPETVLFLYWCLIRFGRVCDEMLCLCLGPRSSCQVMAEGSMTVDEIHGLSKIDHWFLRRLERITNFSKKIEVCVCVNIDNCRLPCLLVLIWISEKMMRFCTGLHDVRKRSR